MRDRKRAKGHHGERCERKRSERIRRNRRRTTLCDELHAALCHARTKFRQLRSERAFGSGQQDGFLIGDVMHHFTHELHETRVVGGVLRTHRAQLRDVFAHLVVLGLAFGETLVACHCLAQRGIKDFFLQLRVNFKCSTRNAELIALALVGVAILGLRRTVQTAVGAGLSASTHRAFGDLLNALRE